jgi:hypothetical protein
MPVTAMLLANMLRLSLTPACQLLNPTFLTPAIVMLNHGQSLGGLSGLSLFAIDHYFGMDCGVSADVFGMEL